MGGATSSDPTVARRRAARGRLGACLAVPALILLCLLSAASGNAADADERIAAFRLLDQNGNVFTAQELAGRPTLLHFGFTHCPVVCPTTLFEVAERMSDLGPLADEVNFVFVSVDPQRDTPQVLKEYIASFDPRIIGLTGEEAEIRRLAASIGGKFEKHATKDGSYDMDHSVEGFLLDREGHRLTALHVGYGADPAKTLSALKNLIGGTTTGK